MRPQQSREESKKESRKDVSRRSSKPAARPRHLPVPCACPENCPLRRAEAPSRMRQRRSQSRRILLYLEGQTRIRPRTSAAHQDHDHSPAAIGKGSEAPALLRRPRVHRLSHHPRLSRLSFLVEKFCSGYGSVANLGKASGRAERYTYNSA